MPSPISSQLVTTFRVPSARSARMRGMAPGSLRIVPSIAAAGTPLRRNMSATASAWATSQQNATAV